MPDVTPETLRLMFPRLTELEAVGAAAMMNAHHVVSALALMREACECVAGSLFCTCSKQTAPTVEQLAAVAPLVEIATTGARILPTGND
jgi:hypothetical protein